MTSTSRALLVAAVSAAVIGFGLGWFARVWTEPTVESRAQEAADAIRRKVGELSH